MATTGSLNRQSADETKKRIVEMFDGEASGIKIDQIKISLKCPIMQTRVKMPVRSATCSHLQCFDLESFLILNKQKPTWKCPICNGNAQYDTLLIDQYFIDLLHAIENKTAEEIELLPNGNWKIAGANNSNTSDEITNADDRSGFLRSARDSLTLTRRNIPSTSANVNNSEIITLDSSDDELVSSGDEDDDCLITSATINNLPNVSANRDEDLISTAVQELYLSFLIPVYRDVSEIANIFSEVRSKTCSHLQCFDLENFLILNKQKPRWKCPICNGNAQYDTLLIDQYFIDLLQPDKSKNVEEVELLQNGKWKVVGESESSISDETENVEAITLDDGEEEVITLDDSNADDTSELLVRDSRRNIPSRFANVNNTEIITIDSSDDELVSSGDEDDDCIITSATINSRPNVSRNVDAAALVLSALVLRMLNSSRPPRRNA